MPDASTLLSNTTIAGTGSYVPERVLTNADLEKIVDTSDDWITSRTGIKERRIAADDQATSDLAAAAGLQAMEQAGVTADELDLIIVATISPDMFFPATACFVQRKLGAKKAVAFDISAACSGFLYALQVARQFISGGDCTTALVIGAEKLSSMVDWDDRNTCVLFGDGAGAAVVKKNPDPAHRSGRVLSHVMFSNGDLTDILVVPGGGSACPISEKNASEKLNTIRMEGREVYKHAVKDMRDACLKALEEAGLTADDIDMVIPHQANLRIIEAITQRLGIPDERTFINLEKYGNTSAAAVIIALDEANRSGAIKPGDKILLVAFGAGLTWAATVIQW